MSFRINGPRRRQAKPTCAICTLTPGESTVRYFRGKLLLLTLYGVAVGRYLPAAPLALDAPTRGALRRPYCWPGLCLRWPSASREWARRSIACC